MNDIIFKLSHLVTKTIVTTHAYETQKNTQTNNNKSMNSEMGALSRNKIQRTAVVCTNKCQ